MIFPKFLFLYIGQNTSAFVSFKKINLLRGQKNNTLNLECKDVRDQFLENLNFAIHFL